MLRLSGGEGDREEKSARKLDAGPKFKKVTVHTQERISYANAHLSSFLSRKREGGIWCPRGDSNSHSQKPTDFESAASTNSATGACPYSLTFQGVLVNAKIAFKSLSYCF
jgi:hypothetical protein